MRMVQVLATVALAGAAAMLLTSGRSDAQRAQGQWQLELDKTTTGIAWKLNAGTGELYFCLAGKDNGCTMVPQR